jgi:hypothetical protein
MQQQDEDFVVVEGRRTLTLGALIKRLQALKRLLGNNAPVWHVEFGGLTPTLHVEESHGGIVISQD